MVQLSVEGINQLETYFSLYLPQLFYSVLAPVTLFVLTAFLDWKSALVLFVCVPLIPVSIIFVQKFTKHFLNIGTAATTLGDSFLENLIYSQH
ncbi:MAG: ABC transporter transmembrane domain-containing protein [Longibaculum sp.]